MDALIPQAFTANTTSQAAARRARVAAYRHLTRDLGARPKQAAEHIGVTLSTALAYEREIAAATGQTHRQARQALYARLRAQGLGRHRAAHRVGICIKTAHRYEAQLRDQG